MTSLLRKLQCWLKGHSLHYDDLSRRDPETGNVKWPCQRCGYVQVVPYGLAAEGTFTKKRLKT